MKADSGSVMGSSIKPVYQNEARLRNGPSIKQWAIIIGPRPGSQKRHKSGHFPPFPKKNKKKTRTLELPQSICRRHIIQRSQTVISAFGGFCLLLPIKVRLSLSPSICFLLISRDLATKSLEFGSMGSYLRKRRCLL